MTDNYFLETLEKVFEDRVRRNPAYSLRAFARDLQLSPSRLSQIMNGQLGLSRIAAEAISQKISLSPLEKAHFCDSVAAQYDRSRLEKQKAALRLQKYTKDRELQQISLDQFAMISDWYHNAILELTTVKGFQSSAEWVAKALEISTSQAKKAIARLMRLGFLKEVNGKWIANFDVIITPTDIPSVAIRSYHEQILNKAILAIGQQSIEERDFGASNISISKEQILEIKKEIREFRKNLIQKFSATQNKEAVYCLSTQFFKLTKDL